MVTSIPTSEQPFRAWLKLAAAWAAFVFIPFNLFAGVLLGNNFGSSDALAGLCVGAVVLLSLTIAPVAYASATGRTFADAVQHEIRVPAINAGLRALVPVVNIGWFAIQTIAAVQLVARPSGAMSSVFAHAVAATIFIAGPVLAGYRWLAYFGAVGVAAMVAALAVVLMTDSARAIDGTMLHWYDTGRAAALVVGTWIFSSTTIVMDVAREVPRPRAAVAAILCGTAVANILLIAVGFFYPRLTAVLLEPGSGSSTFGLLIAALLIIALWTTNDSNFYSTEKALRSFGVPTTATSLVVIAVTAIAGVAVGDGLFVLVGPWLQLMGWIGIPMGVFWAIRYLRRDRKTEPDKA